MRFVGLPQNVVDVEFPAKAGVEFADASFNFSAQLSKRLDALQQLTAELLLRSFWKGGHLADRDL